VIGNDIPGVPNKRRGGVILGSQIAPIFFNTARDSCAIPIRCDVSGLKNGMTITIDFVRCMILDEKGNKITEFRIEPETLPDEYRAGGRLLLIIGKELTRTAQEALGKGKPMFIESSVPHASSRGFTLAQKMVGKACGVAGVRPWQSCLRKLPQWAHRTQQVP